MWNARKAQLDLEHGSHHHLTRRSRSRSPPPTAHATARNGSGGVVPVRRRSYYDAVNGRDSGHTVSAARSSRGDSGSHSLQSGYSAGSGSLDLESPSDQEAAMEAERKLEELLSKSRVRGRGAVGPRADEPGPYLPASAAGRSPSSLHTEPALRLRFQPEPVHLEHLSSALPFPLNELLSALDVVAPFFKAAQGD